MYLAFQELLDFLRDQPIPLNILPFFSSLVKRNRAFLVASAPLKNYEESSYWGALLGPTSHGIRILNSLEFALYLVQLKNVCLHHAHFRL